ncbi:hypothetical protein FACS1894200_04060 [Spirochaetia bacterium]|nr:hypothetical protein FACS1894200_04060 [Spirochaetia bacterium]
MLKDYNRGYLFASLVTTSGPNGILSNSEWGNSNSKSLDCDSKSLDYDSKSLDCDSKSLDCDSKSLDCGSKSLDYDSKSLDCGSKSLDCDSKSLDCDSKSLDYAPKSLDYTAKIVNVRRIMNREVEKVKEERNKKMFSLKNVFDFFDFAVKNALIYGCWNREEQDRAAAGVFSQTEIGIKDI